MYQDWRRIIEWPTCALSVFLRQDAKKTLFTCGGERGLLLQFGITRFQNGSMNITVKNVPEPIYRTIKREAKRNRRSLNAEIIQALETEAAEAGRRRQLTKLRKELDRFAATLPPLGDSAPLIRQDRQR